MEPAVDFSAATWRKSSRSSASGPDCVEIAFAQVNTGIRDSKNPASDVLAFGVDGWGRFLGATKGGAFDPR